MTPQDFPAQLKYANWFMGKQKVYMIFMERVLFVDESGYGKDEVLPTLTISIYAPKKISMVYGKLITNRNSTRMFGMISYDRLI